MKAEELHRNLPNWISESYRSRFHIDQQRVMDQRKGLRYKSHDCFITFEHKRIRFGYLITGNRLQEAGIIKAETQEIYDYVVSQLPSSLKDAIAETIAEATRPKPEPVDMDILDTVLFLGTFAMLQNRRV